MTEFTRKYGAITSIIDDTRVYSMNDTDGTDFLFEVYPLNISEDEINETLKDDNRWFIYYKTYITRPHSYLIKKAIDEGNIIKLSINCEVYDNYGILHNIFFDKEKEKYRINTSYKLTHLSMNTMTPFNDKLIELIKINPTPEIFIMGINNSIRYIFGLILDRLDKQNEIIKILDDKIKILEGK